MQVSMTLNDPRTSRLAFAGVAALTVLTWYALPDAVRSRRARTVIKAGLLGVTAAGAAMIPRVFPEERQLKPDLRIDLPGPAGAALAVGATAVATVATIWFEKAIYARGERKRARGVRCAHTPAAAAMALATGAAALIDWTKLASRVAKN
jgi:hypothetical protein